MKSIVFFLSFLIASIYSFGQTIHLPEIISKNNNHKLSLSDEKYLNINPNDIQGFLFSGEGDIIDSTQYWFWDQNIDEWVLTNRTFYELDINGNILNQEVLVWNGIQWVNSRRDEWTYDAYNNQLTVLFQTWNGSAWDNINLTLNTYDADNNRTSRTNQNWNGTTWVNATRQLSTYDDQNNILTRTNGLWLGSEWSNGLRLVYTYDVNNILILQEVQHWNGVDYATDQQILYSYNSAGDLDTSLTQSWETDHWEDISRNIFEYDANHNRTSYLNQMAVGDGTWIDVLRFIFTIDSDNNITGQLYEAFLNEEWVKQYQFLAEYDTRQNRITEVFQLWEDEWVNQDSFHYYYTLSTGISEVLIFDKMKLYPNPVTTTFNIDHLSAQQSHGTYTIFSQNGLRMMEGEMNDLAKTTIDVSQLLPGNYFILSRMGSMNSVYPFIKLEK